MRPPATGSPLTSSVTSPPVAGFGASAAKTISTLTSPAGKRRLGLLRVLEHAEHRVVVLQLPVLDVEREAAEVVERRHDHALDAALRDDEVGADRVRVVVDPRDHPGGDVLDPAAVGELRLLRDRRHDPVEGREPAEDRQHLVALRLLPEELAQLLDLLRMLARRGSSPARSRRAGSRARPGRRRDPSPARSGAAPPGRAARGCAAGASRATSRPCTSPGCRPPRSTAACAARARRRRRASRRT